MTRIEPTHTATSHMPSWLRLAMRAHRPVRIEFEASSGYITVFPDQKCFTSNLTDLSSAMLWGKHESRFLPSLLNSDAADARPLTELQWDLTLKGLQRKVPEYEFQYRVLRLASWPALTQLPDDMLPVVSRICALLARRQTAGSLVPLLLGLPKEQVFALIETLRLNGHVQVVGLPVESAKAQEHAADDSAPLSAIAAQPATGSLLGKIWHRLIGSR